MTKYFTLSLLLLGSILLSTAAEERVHDLEAQPSIASDYKVQAVQSNKYGYPYRIAPTLTPVIQARSDDDDNEDALTSVPAQGKPYGARITEASKEDGTPVKKGHLKKSNAQYATRRQDSPGKRFRSYVQPKYRNLDELEADFQPRRMDIDIPYASSPYEYTKLSRKPPVSPIDPYLTPSAAPGDSFYPILKAKPYSPSSYGHSYGGPSYGAGKYEDPVSSYPARPYGGSSPSYPSSGGPSSSYTSSGGPSSSYTSSGGPSSSYPSSGGPSSSYASGGGPSSGYPSSGSKYDHPENYAIKSNEPITGSIRKRLLDYAGASDLYEGEPDYLRQISRNKYKYGNLANDYYSYGGPVHRDSYRDFPYVESKISLLKKARAL